jgi:hypothetical protein
MKTLPQSILAVTMALIAMVASGPAMAQHHRGGGVRVGVHFGLPLYWPGYYAAPYYPYPAYAYPGYAYPAPAYVYAQPPVYVERGGGHTAIAPAQPQGDWYFCAQSNSYYPYVRECAGGWQRVPSQPPATR